MINRICSCYGQVFLAHCDLQTQSVIVSVYDYHETPLGNNSDHFVKVCDIYAPVKAKRLSFYDLIKCGNCATGLFRVILILQYESGEISLFVCSNSEKSYQLVEIECLFSSAECLYSNNDNICLCDGPEIACVRGTKIHLHSLNSKKSRVYDLQNVLSIQISHVSILQFSLIKQHETVAGSLTKYFLAVRATNDNTCMENIFFFFYIQNVCDDTFHEEFFPLRTDYFFPMHFHSLVMAINVRISSKTSVSFSERVSLKNYALQLCWSGSRTLVCSLKQCLVFYNGLLKYCCNIPFCDVSKIFTLRNDGPIAQNENIILQSSSKGVCCVKKSSQINSFQCNHVWKDVIMTCKGSFLQNGCEQLLLFTSVDFNSWQNDLILFDFTFSHPIASVTRRAATVDFLQNTLTGLQKRVLTGKATVMDLHCRISEKQAATKEVLKRLQGYYLNQNHFTNDKDEDSLVRLEPFPFSLVDIISLKDGNDIKEDTLEKVKDVSAAAKIIGHWKTILNERWILGWTLENISDRYVNNPMIKLLFSQSSVTAVQQSFVHPSTGLASQPGLTDSSLGIDQIRPGDMFSVVICVAVPDFVTDTVHVSSIISWNICANKELENRHSWRVNNKVFTYQQITTNLAISVTDQLENDYLKGLSAIQKLMSFRVLQHCTLLLISSAYSDLSTFKDILNSGGGKYCPEFFRYLQVNYLIFSNALSPLFGINMTWNLHDKSTLEVAVYVRTEKDITLLSQWLYQNMPDDILILPSNAFQKKKKLLITMKNEIDFVSETLSLKNSCSFNFHHKVNENVEIEHGQADREAFQKDSIVLSKEEFYNMRMELVEKEMLADSLLKSSYN